MLLAGAGLVLAGFLIDRLIPKVESGVKKEMAEIRTKITNFDSHIHASADDVKAAATAVSNAADQVKSAV